MKLNNIVISLAALLSTSGAISLREPRDESPQVVSLGLQRKAVSDPIAHDRNRHRLRRRDKTATATIDNAETLYYLNLTLGTPEQHFRLHVDTGSSDLWVNQADSSLCQQHSAPCDISGTYSANDSSTYKYVNSLFNISYADGSGALGDYATDTLRVAAQTFDDFQFGIGYQSSSQEGVLGVGYVVIEAQTQGTNGRTYENLPARMVKDGIINSNAYSLYLDDLEASTGQVLFGGVDRAQYHGDLVTLPIQKEDGLFAEFLVTLTSVVNDGDTLGDNSGSLALAALLDSGTSLTYLPNAMVSILYDEIGAIYDSSSGSAAVPCALANEDFNMTFIFSNSVSIDVPIAEMVLNPADIFGDQQQAGGSNQEQVCLFGVAPGGGDSVILGDTFLRSAYVVYDLDNNEISLAQSRFNVTETDIAEIGVGSDAVPAAASASSNVVATAGSTPAVTVTTDSTGNGNDRSEERRVGKECRN